MKKLNLDPEERSEWLKQQSREKSRRYREKNKDQEKQRKSDKRACLKGRCDLLYENALSRARKRGMEFTITREYVRDLMSTQNERCVLTGIKFDYSPPEGVTFNPYSPSLDRLDNNKGYTHDNVRLILTCVNLAFNQFGKELFDSWVIKYIGVNKISK